MKARWKILIAFGIFVLLAVGSLMTSRFRAANAVEACKKSLRAKGERLGLAEVQPTPPPAASNSVEAVQAAFRLLGSVNLDVPDAMKMIAPGKALVGARQPDARGFNFTNSWEDFSAQVSADRPAIEQLRQALERPALDFGLDYTKGFRLLLPHLAPMKRAAQKLTIAAIVDLHNGDTAAATTNVLTLLELIYKDNSDGLPISLLVRIAVTSIAVTPTWELLQATNVTDAQLAVLQKGWERMDFLADATNVYVVERAFGIDKIEQAQASHGIFQQSAISPLAAIAGSPSGSGWNWQAGIDRVRNGVGEFFWRSSWSYADELRRIQTDSILLETARTMRTNQTQFYKADYDAMVARLSPLDSTNPGQTIFSALGIPDFSDIFGGIGIQNSVRKVVQIETVRRIMVTAIALKRFQLKHGRLPDTLGELAPEFLDGVPIDPMDGKLLKYRPNADGTFLLYSVAEDGKDDGGDTTVNAPGVSSSLYWLNNRIRDWVWPQPATAEEIKNFYDHPRK